MRSWLRRQSLSLCGASLCLALVPLPQMGRGEIEIVNIAFVVAFVILSLALHEAAHAWVAWKCGDPTAKDLGRITLNPIASIDPIWTILVPAITLYSGLGAFGGAKPVPVDMRRLRHPLRDMMLVALAGPATNFLLAIVFYLAFKVAMKFGDYHPADLLPSVVVYAMYSNLLLTVFNLLPIPPLDGSRVMAWLLPESLREPYMRLEAFGIILVFVLMRVVPGLRELIASGMDQLADLIDILTFGSW
ncbi:MAG: site-2 protease family protein [Planctomycetes bacterium]|nr:site-2 protease family protein [Planctomycetota bacterium]